jgi:hypothetical protein
MLERATDRWRSRGRRGSLAALVAAAAGLLLCSDAVAQAPRTPEPIPDRAPTILRSGERLDYGLSLGPIHAGRATLVVGGPESIDGVTVHRVELTIAGGAPFFRLDDDLVSWIATDPLRTVRSDRRFHQGAHRRSFRLELTSKDRRYRIVSLSGVAPGDADGADSGPMPEAPLDELAILFLPRTIPLEPGSAYRLPRFFDDRRNPIDLRVVGRSRVRTPAGSFDAIELSVAIEGSGLFAPERHARVFVTDDPGHTVVRLTTNSRLGRLQLYLKHRLEAGG